MEKYFIKNAASLFRKRKFRLTRKNLKHKIETTTDGEKNNIVEQEK